MAIHLHTAGGLPLASVIQEVIASGVWPRGGFGPRVQAIVALCTGAYSLSKHTTQDVLHDLVGLALSLGTITHLEQATVQALAAPVAEAHTYIRAQPVAHLDETGWREGHTRAWLWVAVTEWGTVFAIRVSRGAKVAQALLGERFCGLLVTDRWSAYTWHPTRWRQICWAHLLRDFEAMIERGGRSQEIGEGLREQARQMSHWWHQVCDGTLTYTRFRVLICPRKYSGPPSFPSSHQKKGTFQQYLRQK